MNELTKLIGDQMTEILMENVVDISYTENDLKKAQDYIANGMCTFEQMEWAKDVVAFWYENDGEI